MKIKRKGAYQYEGLGWHQDQGGLVIPKAAEAFMLYGTPIEEFVKGHSDIYDFMLRTKVPRDSKLMWNGVQQQNICRYYVAQNGHPLQKIMPPLTGKEEERIMDICSGWNVKVCNNLRDFDGSIDFTYYIEEAEKLVI